MYLLTLIEEPNYSITILRIIKFTIVYIYYENMCNNTKNTSVNTAVI